jgi:hypothetical protein
MTDATNPKLAKVRSLLDTAESLATQGNTEAAENYRNKAISLMVTHGIDEAMVAAAGHKREEPEQRTFHVPNPYRVDKQFLLQYTAEGLGCKTVRITRSATVHIVGFPADLDRVEMLWTSLLLQAFGEVARTSGSTITPSWSWLTGAEKGSVRVSYTKSFLQGFSVVIGKRLYEATARARQDYEASHQVSTALVVVDRTKRVQSMFVTAFPQVSTANRRVANGTAYGRGGDAGQRADIGTTRVGGARKQIG